MKKLMLIIAIGIFLLLTGETSYAQRVDSVIVITINDMVVAKKLPGVKGKFAFQVPKGAVIVVYAATKGLRYYEISYSNQTGYTYESYLADALSRKDFKAIRTVRNNLTTYETNKDALKLKSEIAYYQKVTSQRASGHPGQSYSTISYLTPGDELLRYNKLKNVSYTMYGGTIGLGIIVAAAGSEMEQNTIIGIGAAASVLAITGFIIDIVATQHVGRAGLLLNKNGVGVSINLTK